MVSIQEPVVTEFQLLGCAISLTAPGLMSEGYVLYLDKIYTMLKYKLASKSKSVFQ